MNAIFNVLSVVAFFLSLAGLLFSARSAIRVQELRDRLAVLPLSRLNSLETSLADTQDALAEVANRVKMMKVRNASSHVRGNNADPDPHTDPDAWRRVMNSKLSIANRK